MNHLILLFALTLASAAGLSANEQIPPRALCSVCALKSGETTLEEVRAHS